MPTSEQVQKRYGPLVPLESWKLVEVSDLPELAGLVLTTDSGSGHGPRVYHMSHRRLLQLAGDIQQLLDPTPEQQILGALERIEKLLRKSKKLELVEPGRGSPDAPS